MTDAHMQAFLLPAPLRTTPRYNTATQTYSQMCNTCTLPVELHSNREPIDGVRDGLEVAHSDCYKARCPNCGTPWRNSCVHRTFDRDGYQV